MDMGQNCTTYNRLKEGVETICCTVLTGHINIQHLSGHDEFDEWLKIYFIYYCKYSTCSRMAMWSKVEAGGKKKYYRKSHR